MFKLTALLLLLLVVGSQAATSKKFQATSYKDTSCNTKDGSVSGTFGKCVKSSADGQTAYLVFSTPVASVTNMSVYQTSGCSGTALVVLSIPCNKCVEASPGTGMNVNCNSVANLIPSFTLVLISLALLFAF